MSLWTTISGLNDPSCIPSSRPWMQSSADPAELASLRAFQVKLSQLGHYWSSYKSIEDLQLQFSRQLDTLLFY